MILSKDIIRGLVISGWIVLVVLMIGIIVSAVYMLLSGVEPPDTLREWASMSLGFLFAKFFDLISVYMRPDVLQQQQQQQTADYHPPAQDEMG